ncbi:MAG: phosphatidylglycerophosphatase A family protein [Terriglobia bacterium]
MRPGKPSYRIAALRQTLNKPRAGAAVRVATVGPVGHFPVAPGTAGSVVGVILTLLIRRLPLARWEYSGVMAAAIIVIFAAGVWGATKAEQFYGVKDPGSVVIDEVAGQMIVFLFQATAGWLTLLAGFIFFRIFDILKPFPARRAEHLPGGWGIMTDDLVAGAYGAAALFLVGFSIR